MNEIRHDPLTGAAVAVTPGRQQRPNLPATGCPFCVGGLESPNPYDVKWFTNRWPAMPDERCEVILYSSAHDENLGTIASAHVERLIEVWAERTAHHRDREDVSYVLIFENRGAEVGATISHPHGQLYAYAEIPPVVARELELANAECSLCAKSNDSCTVATEDGWILRTAELPVWPYEMVLQPIAHEGDLDSVQSGWPAFARLLSGAIDTLDRHLWRDVPYMMWIHQTPVDGKDWPQAHLHAHIAPLQRTPTALRYVAAAEWGAGVYFNPVPADVAAAELRAAWSR